MSSCILICDRLEAGSKVAGLVSEQPVQSHGVLQGQTEWTPSVLQERGADLPVGTRSCTVLVAGSTTGVQVYNYAASQVDGKEGTTRRHDVSFLIP